MIKPLSQWRMPEKGSALILTLVSGEAAAQPPLLRSPSVRRDQWDGLLRPGTSENSKTFRMFRQTRADTEYLITFGPHLCWEETECHKRGPGAGSVSVQTTQLQYYNVTSIFPIFMVLRRHVNQPAKEGSR